MHSIRNKVVAVGSAAAILVVSGYLLFRARNLSPGYVPLHTFLDDASGLMDGTQVRLNGLPVGYLDTQKLTNSRDPRRKVEFVLRVQSRYLADIPEDSRVGMASDNLLGDQYIGIRAGTSKRHVQPGAELAAVEGQDITRLMANMSRELDRLQSIADRAAKLTAGIDRGEGNVGEMLKKGPVTSSSFSSEMAKLTNDIQHGNGTVTKMLYGDPLEAQLKSPLDRMNAIGKAVGETTAKVGDFQKEVELATSEFQGLQNEMKNGSGSIAKMGQLQARFDALTTKAGAMIDRMNSGHGTLAQLQVNPQLNEAIAGAQREFQELAKGLRANPRKFIAIHVF